MVEKWSGGATPYPYVVRVNTAGQAAFGAYDMTNNPAKVSTATVNDGQWHLITGVRTKGVTLSLYVDGVAQGSPITDTTVGSTANSSLVGVGARGVGTQLYQGHIDDVRMYDRALTAVEIEALYESHDTQINAGSRQNGLVGHWKFDGNAKDSTPYANNGTASGGIALTTDRKGTANASYDFDGVDDQVLVNANSLPTTLGPKTMQAWIKPGTVTIVKNIMTLYNTSGSQEALFRISASSRLQLVNTGGVVAPFSATVSLAPNTWLLVTYTWDGSNNRFYINGAQDGTNDASLPNGTDLPFDAVK